MKNYYQTYLVVDSFIIENQGNALTVNVNDELEVQHYLFVEKEKFYKCKFNNQFIIVDEKDIKIKCKNMMLLYQEQFSHLNKNSVYFGQLENGKRFFIEENGQTKYYQKIGEYTDRNSDTYNVVQLKDYRKYFNPIELEDYNNVVLGYFNDDIKIDSQYETNYEGIIEREKFENNFFKPPMSLKICESIVEEPKMLEVIEYLFSNKELTPELMKVYDDYHEYRNEELDLGYTAYNNKSLNEIIDDINKKNTSKKFKM